MAKSKQWCVYVVTRAATGDPVYVGMTSDITRRVRNHFGQRGVFFLLPREAFRVKVLTDGLTFVVAERVERALTTAMLADGERLLNVNAGTHPAQSRQGETIPVVIDDSREDKTGRAFVHVRRVDNGQEAYAGWTTVHENWLAVVTGDRPLLPEDGAGYLIAFTDLCLSKRTKRAETRAGEVYVFRDAMTGEAVYCGSTHNLSARVADHVRRDALAGEDEDAYDLTVVHRVIGDKTAVLAAERELTMALIASGEPLRNRGIASRPLTVYADWLKTVNAHPLVLNTLRRLMVDSELRNRQHSAAELRRSTTVIKCLATGKLYASAALAARDAGVHVSSVYLDVEGGNGQSRRWMRVDKRELNNEQITAIDKQIASEYDVPMDVRACQLGAGRRQRRLTGMVHVNVDDGVAWATLAKASIATGSSYGAISNAESGRAKTAAGKRWRRISMSTLSCNQVDELIKSGQCKLTKSQIPL